MGKRPPSTLDVEVYEKKPLLGYISLTPKVAVEQSCRGMEFEPYAFTTEELGVLGRGHEQISILRDSVYYCYLRRQEIGELHGDSTIPTRVNYIYELLDVGN